MSQTEKAKYFNDLKAAGVTFEKHYREYSTAELKPAWDRLQAASSPPQPPADEQPPLPLDLPTQSGPPLPPPADGPPPGWEPMTEEEQAAFLAGGEQAPPPPDPAPEAKAFDPAFQQLDFNARRETPPVKGPDPNEMAGARQNTQGVDEPIRTDEYGRVWYQEEIRKSAIPKPRARRILTYQDSGFKQETVKTGDFVETFEVPGTGAPRTSEVKITLPSYQVGIYVDPRFPMFKIHVYNENQGFDLFDVQEFYGGPEMVPAEAKRKYVENVLCYDIRTTVRAIEAEYRRMQLAGQIKEDQRV